MKSELAHGLTLRSHIHCACLKVNNPPTNQVANQPSENPTHRYNSFIAHARIHKLKMYCHKNFHNCMLSQEKPVFKISTKLGLLIPKYFFAVYDYGGKEDLRKDYWNPKRKFGVTTHILEIIKQHLF